MVVDFDAPFERVLAPQKLAHVVLRTPRFQQMVQFYKTFLGGWATYENDHLSFLTYDDEHHRVALANVPGTSEKIRTSAGLEHIAFTYEKLEDLAQAYRQRKAKGILPIWCVNHGPTTSIYYQDPDGNQLETQVDNFDDAERADEFMKSTDFAKNPIGVDFDPEELISKLKAGVPDRDLKKRPSSGTRGIDTIPAPPPLIPIESQ